MRQAGVLAAAGLIALEEMTLRLGEDHANARLLAEGLAKLAEVEIDLEAVQTNIVIFELRNGRHDSLLERLKARRVLASTVNPPGIRLVTHHDVGREACEQALAILTEEIRKA